MKSRDKKSKGQKASAEKLALGKVLKSTGVLLPETEDEIEAFNTLYGNTPVELPEKLKTINFLFGDETAGKKVKIIPMIPLADDEYVPQLAYAARDGQAGLPEEILKKMNAIKKEKRAIKKPAPRKKK